MTAHIAAKLKVWQVDLILSVLTVERVSQRPLPNNSFYKAIALDILRRYNLEWRDL